MVLLLFNLVILGRLLTPLDFGLVAMVTAVIGVAELLRDFGITTASIQAEHLSRKQKNNLFLINSGLGLGLAALTALFSQPLAAFYQDPRLIPITLAISSVFLLNGIQAQYQVEMTRTLRFKTLTITDVASNAIALCVAIIASILGAGYWALIMMQLVAAVLLLVSRMATSEWHPGWPGRSGRIGRFLRYGGHLGLAQFINYVSANAPSVLLGYAFGPVSLGAYSRASQIATLPVNQIFGPLTNVALTTLVRLNNSEQFERTIAKLQLMLGYAAAIGFSFLIVLAKPLVSLLLGHQWESAVPLLQILCAGATFQAATFVSYWVFLAKGQTGSLLKYNLVTKGIVLLLTILGTFFGVQGIVIGYSLGLVAAWPISLIWMSKNRIPSGPLFFGGFRFISLGVAAVSAGLVLPVAFDQLPTIISSTIGWAVGLLLPFVFRQSRSDVGMILATVSSMSTSNIRIGESK